VGLFVNESRRWMPLKILVPLLPLLLLLLLVLQVLPLVLRLLKQCVLSLHQHPRILPSTVLQRRVCTIAEEVLAADELTRGNGAVEGGAPPRIQAVNGIGCEERKKEREKELRVKKVVANEGGGGRGEIQTKGKVLMQLF
jgi:hypothetical protein